MIEKAETESQELQPWTAVSTWLGRSRQHGVATGCLTDRFLEAHGNDLRWMFADCRVTTDNRQNLDMSFRDKETVDRQKLSRRKYMAKPC